MPGDVEVVFFFFDWYKNDSALKTKLPQGPEPAEQGCGGNQGAILQGSNLVAPWELCWEVMNTEQKLADFRPSILRTGSYYVGGAERSQESH